MRKSYLFVFTFLFLSIHTFGQSSKKKILMDANLKSPIKFAHVVVNNNKSSGTLTNHIGEFELSNYLNETDSLTISHISYQSKTILVSDLLSMDTLFLRPKSETLQEIVFYDLVSIMEKVYQNIPKNYSNARMEESFFVRYFSKQNHVKFQIVESRIQTEKKGYFNQHEPDQTQILMHAQAINQNDKLDGIEYIPFDYFTLVSLADIHFELDDSYELSYESVDLKKIKVSYKSIDEKITKDGFWGGYLIINLEDYGILEYYYERRFNAGSEKKELKKGYWVEYNYKSNLRKWEKNQGSDKYQLKLMEVEDELDLYNEEKQLKNKYTSNYLMIESNFLGPQNSTPKKIKNKKKAITEYKSYNANTLKDDKTILKSKDQIFDN